MSGLMYHWAAVPPALPADTAITNQVAQTRGERVYVGKSWLGRREGLNVLYLTGTPFEMGYANGVLTQKLMDRQEQALLDLLNRVAPYEWTQFLLKFMVVYKNRHLPQHVLPEYQTEILGITLGCPDPHPEVGPYYYRVLNYHAAQDISYMMMNSPLLRRGCTVFGAWGNHTRDGHLLAGRNFDWEAHPVFDEDRLLILCEPKDGIPFVSLAWSGMAGAVSGMNREGLAITVNGAPSDLPGDSATPTCLVAREVLQRARNLAEAVDIIRRRQVFVSAMFLVGSRQDGHFVIVEKTPTQTVIQEPGATPWIICANLYQTPELKNLPINLEYQRMDTSMPRYQRMQELLQAAKGLDIPQSVNLLRDRRLPGNVAAGNGHRSTLNPLIATHAVLMDLTEGLFWAGTSPHQLGKFVAVDVRRLETELPEKTLPADTMLASGEYQRYLAAKGNLEVGRSALKQKQFAVAAQYARQAETNNPGYYQNAWLLAESLFRSGHTVEAAQACASAVAGQPALGGERRQLDQLARDIAQASGSKGGATK